jgi:hypothetical protein
MSPTVNAPAPIRPADEDAILDKIAGGLHRVERNTTDPRPWIPIVTGDTWDSGTGYSAGDFAVDDVPGGSVLLGYQCLVANTGHEPGVDPNWMNYWVPIGPPFQNGFANAGGSRVPLRYRLMREYDPGADQQGVEIQGSVTTGALGDTIFTLLQPGYAPDGTPAWSVFGIDFDLHLPACDDLGSFVPFSVLQSGDVAYGFV